MTEINFTQIAANGPNHEEINHLRRPPLNGDNNIAETIQEILKEEAKLEKKYRAPNASEQALLDDFEYTGIFSEVIDEPN